MQEEDPKTGEQIAPTPTPTPTPTPKPIEGDPPEGGGSKITPQPLDGDPPEGGGMEEPVKT